jgi:hypothetical protein
LPLGFAKLIKDNRILGESEMRSAFDVDVLGRICLDMKCNASAQIISEVK